ncbi:motile sperm domain-containing protein 2-like [Brevipalpus obovatus]|uniref:motile sperm domain-containing protein 2-like n=1 Tax=Brevipalpus obovatus TaxID=246614 RepID=UPI003D9E5465
MPDCDYIWPEELIPQVRKEFLILYETECKDMFDEIDVQEVLTDDWWIRRFLIHNAGDPDLALDGLINCLKWREEIKIRSISDRHFPEELYRVGALFQYSVDQNKVPTLYIRLKLVRRLPAIQDLIKLFIAYNFNAIDTAAHGQGWGLIIDFDGAGIQNADMDLAKFIVFSLKCYFPSSLSYVFCLDFPWFLRAFWSVVKAWLPKKRTFALRFIGRKQLSDYIYPEYLPDFVNGKCKQAYSYVPIGCPRFVDYCVREMNIPRTTAEKMYTVYKPFLQPEMIRS